MQRIQVEHSLPHVRFWGKITGIKKDYLIVRAVTADEKMTREFYYSADGGVSLSRMPVPDEWANEIAPHITGYFTGNPKTFHRDPRLPLTEEEKDALESEEDSTEYPPEERDPSAPRQICEAERLAYVVSVIDARTSVVPRGAYVLSHEDNYVPNPTFCGLSLAQALDLSQYVLFVPPTTRETLRTVATYSLEARANTLDPLSDTLLEGVWGIQLTCEKDSVLVRSFEYPGYEFTHELNTLNYAGFYYGHAALQPNIAHMLP
jgi:hypothetical protein